MMPSRLTIAVRRLIDFKVPPPALLVVFYLVLIVLGGLILWLPAAHNGAIGFGEAMFTSTSAVTVTGLVVADTGTAFTGFGQAVIAVLIQLGGLGLMTFAVMVLSALGIPVGMSQRLALREDLNQTSLSNLIVLAKIVFAVAVCCQVIGCIALSFVFVPEYGWNGVWQAAFHAISAFNNAGFALHPDSLARWVDDPVINTIVPLLFILGGLGFIVVSDIHQKRAWHALTLHTKLMLVGTAVLIVWGTISFALLEWNNPETLGGLSTSGKLWASWFQGVSPRTAGFNTVDTGGMRESTTLLTMALMVVGGGSTSTAGGIKVTSLCVLLLATIAFFRRSRHLNAFGCTLGVEEVMKVMALTTTTMLILVSGVFLMSITHNGPFLDLAFEVTSAFGTVGLSRGATGELDGFSRVVVMVIMFIGRVGPLSIGFFLATSSVPRIKYPPGHVHIG